MSPGSPFSFGLSAQEKEPVKYQVLYIHPRSQMQLDEIIPISVPALVERLDVPVLGRFHYEVRDSEVRDCKIVIMDIHWYLSLPGAIKLARKLRRINPEVTIIAGGITASLFAGEIVRDSEIDYVVRGDAEVPVEQLVEAILENKDVHDIPNLAHADFETPWSYSITSEILDSLEFNNVDFFPTLKKNLAKMHNRPGNRTFSAGPYVMAFRGCPLACLNCLGAPKAQISFFNRNVMFRSAQKLKGDFERIESDPAYQYVNVIHDFACLMPEEYWREVLDHKYDLKIYYSFAGLPSADELEALMGSFTGGRLVFSLDKYHSTSKVLVDIDALIDRLQRAHEDKEYNTSLAYSETYCREDADYKAAVERVRRETNVILNEVSFWWTEVPQKMTDPAQIRREYERYAHNKGHRFAVLNTSYRLFYHLHGLFPRSFNFIADRMIHVLSYRVNTLDMYSLRS